MSLRKSPRRTGAFLAANRRNSRKSTGPRTELGKWPAAEDDKKPDRPGSGNPGSAGVPPAFCTVDPPLPEGLPGGREAALPYRARSERRYSRGCTPPGCTPWFRCIPPGRETWHGLPARAAHGQDGRATSMDRSIRSERSRNLIAAEALAKICRFLAPGIRTTPRPTHWQRGLWGG